MPNTHTKLMSNFSSIQLKLMNRQEITP